MGCWKWFNRLIEEAGIEINYQNKKKVDNIIHNYISEQSNYGRCSTDWKKARKEIEANDKMKKELILKLSLLKQ